MGVNNAQKGRDRIPVMFEPGLVEQDRAFSDEQKRQALDLVLRSETFSRADQLKKFLHYICEMDQSGLAGQITEYSIGTHALGRPEDYSPTADSGVRGRAHALRQKLAKFYETERPDAPLRIGLRKGSYVPYFYEVVVPSAHPPPVEVTEPAPAPTVDLPPSPRRRLSLRIIAASLPAAAILFGLGTWVGTNVFARHPHQDLIVEEFWGPLVGPGSDVLLCLAGAPSLMIKPFPQPPSKPDIFRPVPPEAAEWYSHLRLLGGTGKPYMYYSTENPLFGGAAAAVVAAQTVSATGGAVEILPENSLRPAALQNRNVIVIGGPNYSVYAARVLRNTPLVIREDPALGEEVIADRQASSNAAALFVPHRDANNDLVVCYGLITVFPNSTSKRTTRTIVISGVTGAGTEAAMLFFANPAGLKTLQAQFQKDGLSQIPSSYQVVVRASRDKAVPLTWDLTAYRVMQKPPSLE